MDFIDRCRKLIGIDSTPTQGNWEAAQFVAELARTDGLQVEIQEEFYGDAKQANVIVRTQATRPAKEFMLQTHLDTPDPGPFGLWMQTGHNPFEAHIKDNKIYGLGAADVKLDFLCKLEALKSFSNQNQWKLPPVLVGTFGEETGMAGALKLVRKNKVCPQMALVGEPCDLRMKISGKGMASVEIEVPFSDQEMNYKNEHNFRESTATQSRVFYGQSAHSSTPQLGESAIKKMFETILQLPENLVLMEIDGGVNFNTVPAHAFLEIDPVAGISQPISKKISHIYRAILELEKEFEAYKQPEFTPPHPTLNIGLVRTLQDHVKISGTCRIPPMVPFEVYDSWMNRIRLSCEAVGAKARVSEYKRPFTTDPQSMFVRICAQGLAQLGLPDEPKTLASTNESSIWSRVGIDCVSFGPGKREGNIHTPNEHVSIDDLKIATEFYKLMIRGFGL